MRFVSVKAQLVIFAILLSAFIIVAQGKGCPPVLAATPPAPGFFGAAWLSSMDDLDLNEPPEYQDEDTAIWVRSCKPGVRECCAFIYRYLHDKLVTGKVVYDYPDEDEAGIQSWTAFHAEVKNLTRLYGRPVVNEWRCRHSRCKRVRDDLKVLYLKDGSLSRHVVWRKGRVEVEMDLSWDVNNDRPVHEATYWYLPSKEAWQEAHKGGSTSLPHP